MGIKKQPTNAQYHQCSSSYGHVCCSEPWKQGNIELQVYCIVLYRFSMDLMSERRLHLGRYSPTHRSCVENGSLKRSSAGGHPEGSSSAPLENKGICVRGFPATLSDACIKDGLYHQYRKMGKVLSVVVSGQKDERCGIITFMK